MNVSLRNQLWLYMKVSLRNQLWLYMIVLSGGYHVLRSLHYAQSLPSTPRTYTSSWLRDSICICIYPCICVFVYLSDQQSPHLHQQLNPQQYLYLSLYFFLYLYIFTPLSFLGIIQKRLTFMCVCISQPTEKENLENPSQLTLPGCSFTQPLALTSDLVDCHKSLVVPQICHCTSSLWPVDGHKSLVSSQTQPLINPSH